MAILLILIPAFLAAGVFGFRYWSKKQTRKELLGTTLSDHQRAIIAEQVPLIQKLPFELRGKLEGKINLFLDQVEIFGCNGLDISEEMELSIAAQACLLVVNSDTWFRHLSTVLVYPSAFKSKQVTHDGFVVTESEIVRSGESWSRGPVILSWTHAQQGAANDKDGHNVVLHEFAHQIDDLSGQTDGAPLLNKHQSFAEWERVFVEAYKRHVRDVERGRETVLDAYGAKSHEEFFAVAIEVFFEKPVALNHKEPAVYAQLSELLQLDPLSWD